MNRFTLSGRGFRDIWSAWDSVPALRAGSKPMSFEDAKDRLGAMGFVLEETDEGKAEREERQ